MKIAEALILRADIQKRIAQLKTRLNNNAKVQEHEEPTENPQLLLTELDNLISQLNDLIIKINKTNTHREPVCLLTSPNFRQFMPRY